MLYTLHSKLNEGTASLNADREEMAEKKEVRLTVEYEYKVYIASCKKWIEWIFDQDVGSHLVIRAQVMIYSKVSSLRRLLIATSPRMSLSNAP